MSAEEDKYKFSSEEELKKYLESLESEDERTDYLRNLAESLEESDIDISSDIIEDLLSDEASAVQIQQYEEDIARLEAGDNPLDSDTTSNVGILANTLNLPLVQRSPLSAKRHHLFRMLPEHGPMFTGTGNFWGNDDTSGFQLLVNTGDRWNPNSWDRIVDMTDISPGAPFANTSATSITQNFADITFKNVDYTAGSIINKKILVKWASGFEKEFDFEILPKLSGMNMGVVKSTNGSGATWGHGCTGNSNWAMQHSLQMHWAADLISMAQPITQFCISEPIENPAGNFKEFELIAETSNTFGTSGNFRYQPFFNRDTRLSPAGPSSSLNEIFSPNPNYSASQQCKYTFKNVWINSESTIKMTSTQGGTELATWTDIYNNDPTNGVTAGAGKFYQITSGAYWGQGNHNAHNFAWTGYDGLAYYNNAAQFRTIEEEKINDTGWFYQVITYAENLTDCTITGNTYEVCLSPNSPEYYLSTGAWNCRACNGNTIPTLECFGTTPRTFIDGGCCTDCSSLANAGSLSTSIASFGVQNGYITWDVADPNGSATPSGAPWTSGSMYTVAITASNGATLPTASPTGGNTFTTNVTTNVTGGTEHLVTVSSNSQITTGMQISVPSNTEIPAGSYVGAITAGNLNQNVTQFELVDNLGNSVNATAAGTVVGTFATGLSGTFGYLQPNNAGGLGTGTSYQITITDSDGCNWSTTFIIEENPTGISGCTDNTTPALNYNSAAVVDDNSCIVCEAASGNITDPSGGMSGALFDSGTIGTTDATVNSSNVPQSDGNFSLTANMMNTAVAYLESDGTHSYTFTLYDLSVAADPTSIISTVATQASLAQTTYGSSPNHTFTGLAYGHYAIKVQLVDSDEAHGLEPCYTYFFATIKVPVCTDTTANNPNSSSVPAAFQISDNSLCTYAATCCTVGTILEDITTRGTNCSPFLYAELSCNPASTGVTGYWSLDGVQIPNSSFSIGAVSATSQTIWLQDLGGSNLYTADGTYTLTTIATYTTGPSCTVVSSATAFTLPVCGCTDPSAINENPSATIDDGTCIYPSWDCVNFTCTDPGTGNGTWNSNNGGYTACQSSCIQSIPGCTDSCAYNYNSTANVDDGSCTYRACLDPIASNQYWSCDCGSQKTNATIADPTCCTYPCATPNTVTSVTTNSSGSCATPIADGDVVISVTINSVASMWTVAYYDNTNTSLIFTDTTTYTGNTTANSYTAQSGTGLVAGNYYARVTDSLNCIESYQFTIGTTSLTQGCTDPTAQNYDPSAQCDDGSCVYCGCMDLLANNYNPNAVCDDGSCDYTVSDNPCIPPNIDKRILETTACLSEKGTEWLYKYKIGTADDCTIMNKWKLIFIQYLLKNKDLTCLYNCTDKDSPSVTSLSSCAAAASTGGPATGLNDQGHAGSSVTTSGGTLITTPASFFIASNTLFFGDVITMPSGLVWTKTSAGSCTYGCYNPETNQGSTSGNWTQCVPANNITITNSVNYLDNFINFANKYCRDCKIQINTIRRSGRGFTDT